jgi:ABC-type amino acid transport system permease subunit
VIGLNDLMRESLRWAQFYRPFRYFEFITVAGLVYLVLVVAATQAARLLERRTDRAGAGAGAVGSLHRRRRWIPSIREAGP